MTTDAERRCPECGKPPLVDKATCSAECDAALFDWFDCTTGNKGDA